jgi:ATP-binding cassette subfamily F protein 3
MSYEQKKEQEKLIRKHRKAVEAIEAQTAEVESQIAQYDSKFATATEYNEEDYKAYDALKQQLDHLMHEWEKAVYELELVEGE